MKKIFLLLIVITLLVSASFILVNNENNIKTEKDNSPTPYIFKDPAVESVVREKINIPFADLYLRDLDEITHLFLNNTEKIFSSLEDVDMLRNLEAIALWNFNTESLQKLQVGDGIKELEIWFSDIEDIGKLSLNADIENLTFHDCSIENVDLSFFNNLKKLDLSYNRIKDISFLNDQVGLEELYLSGNMIVDFSLVSSLENLKTLYIGFNPVYDLTFAKSLSWDKLEFISCSGLSVSILDNFPEDKTGILGLGLSEMGLTDLGFLRKFPNLEYLSINNNKISTLAPLRDNKYLKFLYARNNFIVDLEPVEGLHSLKVIDMLGNEINSPEEL